jgi:hypothetical protein
MQLELSEIIAIVKHAMPETRRHNRPSPIAVGEAFIRGAAEYKC